MPRHPDNILQVSLRIRKELHRKLKIEAAKHRVSLNNEIALNQAAQLAARLVREWGLNPDRWVQTAWRLALTREPSAQESREACDLMEKLAHVGTGENWSDSLPKELSELDQAQAGALVKFCLTLFNLNEFEYVD